MSVNEATPTPADHAAEELDELFTALADWRRRAVVEHLSGVESATVDALAKRLAASDESLAVFEAKIALLHDQLPRLQDAGVIRFDESERRCRLTETGRTTTLKRLLTTVGEGH